MWDDEEHCASDKEAARGSVVGGEGADIQSYQERRLVGVSASSEAVRRSGPVEWEELSESGLLEHLEAQCTDEQLAGRYGFVDLGSGRIDVDGFLRAVDGELGLRRVYIAGRKSGEARLRCAQWGDGLKNSSERIWLGKQHLGQSEKVEGKVLLERVVVTAGNAEEAYMKLLGGGFPVIEVECEEVAKERPDGLERQHDTA